LGCVSFALLKGWVVLPVRRVLLIVLLVGFGWGASEGQVVVEAAGSAVYVFPVQAARAVRYGPYHHDYPAADIFCPVGSRFVAPTSGVVDYVSWVDRWDPKVNDPATRGGLSVAIIGDDGVRYYGSHLSAVEKGIAPGVRVRAGQTLGRTGKSGDARYVAPHLHFGISHPTWPLDWRVRRGEIAPYRYLVAWQAHKGLRPVLPAAAQR
jgi:murein DD-endopeptidase MepM/ murein hydrolase activator NlpD